MILKNQTDAIPPDAKEFIPTKTKNKLLLFKLFYYLLLIPCVVIVTLCFILRGIINFPIIFILIVFLAWTYGLFFSPLMNPLIQYYTSTQGIYFKDNRRKKTRFILYTDIEFVKVETKDQMEEDTTTTRRITSVGSNTQAFSIQFQTGSWWKNMLAIFKEYFAKYSYNQYSYMSTPVVYSSYNVSGNSKSSVNVPCDVVFIKLKNGEHYFISPLDAKGFTNEVQKYLKKPEDLQYEI